MKKYLAWTCAAIAFGGGVFAWWVDSRNDEPQAAVLVILVVTFSLGVIHPGKAWLWAIIMGLCLPSGYLIARIMNNSQINMPDPDWYASSLAFIPAFLGAYLGALARVIINTTLIQSYRNFYDDILLCPGCQE